MQSVIERNYRLNQIFQKYEVHEVYANEEMSRLGLLVKVTCKKSDLHMAVSLTFQYPINVSITSNAFDWCLHGMNLIWRDGKWNI